MHGDSVAVLGILEQEDHEERHDGGTRVDHELPAIAEMEDRAGGGPDHYDPDRDSEGSGMPSRTRGPLGEAIEGVSDAHSLTLAGAMVWGTRTSPNSTTALAREV